MPSPAQVPAELCIGTHPLKPPNPEPAPLESPATKAICRARSWGNSPAPLTDCLFSHSLAVAGACTCMWWHPVVPPLQTLCQGYPKCQFPEWQPHIRAPLLSCDQLHYATPDAPGTPWAVTLNPTAQSLGGKVEQDGSEKEQMENILTCLSFIAPLLSGWHSSQTTQQWRARCIYLQRRSRTGVEFLKCRSHNAIQPLEERAKMVLVVETPCFKKHSPAPEQNTLG